MRVAAIALLAAVASATAAAAAPIRPQRTVPCAESIDTTPFPYIGNSQPQQRYRAVLDAVSVPPAYLQQVIATRQQPWRYWHKAGLVVRAGHHAVTITVPSRWRTGAAIVWGNSGGPYESLRIAGCNGNPHTGNAYAGGFYLRSGAACVPLTFTVGDRSAVVRFGIGTHCR
ncbi:MAG: hypothetical protein ACRDLM_10800 [Gaiellaceae bacterium]